VSQGFEFSLPEEISLTTTAFRHDFVGLTDFTASCAGQRDPENPARGCATRGVGGRTLGFELLLRRSLTKRLTGFVSYTLSRSTRKTGALRLVAAGTPFAPLVRDEVLSEFDRTHVLNLIGAYDLGRGWRAGARFFYYTGRPYPRTFRGVPVPPFNSERMSPFHRFDARLEKRWTLARGASISFVAEWMNFTLNKEVTSVDCNASGGLSIDTCTEKAIGPITLPSIGVEGQL
jgi:hypothetical protein